MCASMCSCVHVGVPDTLLFLADLQLLVHYVITNVGTPFFMILCDRCQLFNF